MKIYIRFDESNERYTCFTVFLNGANCGQLCTTTEEMCSFTQLLRMAVQSFGKGIDDYVETGKVWVEEEKENGET